MKKIILVVLVLLGGMGYAAWANDMLLLGVSGFSGGTASYERLNDSTGTSLEDSASEALYSTEMS